MITRHLYCNCDEPLAVIDEKGYFILKSVNGRVTVLKALVDRIECSECGETITV